jgi:hypothetical protein
MQDNINRYVKTYKVYQTSKSRRYRPYGELQALPLLDGP